MNNNKIIKGKKTARRYTKINSVSHLVDVLEAHKERVAYRYYDKNKELTYITYEDFANLIRKEAAGLYALGLQGKRIAVIGETSPEWVSTYAAAIAMGSIIIPMDKELEVKEIEGFLKFSEADAIVFSKSFNEKFSGIATSHPTITKMIALNPVDCAFAESEKLCDFDSILALGEKALADGYTFPQKSAEDMEKMAVMLFTSGTTGTSKCVMLCEKNVCAAINAACETVDFTPEDRIVSVLPIHHTYELCCSLAGLNYGMEICINDSLRKVLKNFATFKPTGLVLVPLFVNTMYKKIIDTAKKQNQYGKLKKGIKASRLMRKAGIDIRHKLFASINAAFGGNLKKIISGGAPLNPEMIMEFEEFGISIYEGYGITECSPLVSVTPYYARKPGSVGPAVPQCEARIDPENGYTNDDGLFEGEIQVKGDNVMLGYYKNPEETAMVFTDDGFFRTGDVGYIDADGYIHITGRSKFVIVLENGKNVFPEEIEEYLATIEEIAECVVVGRKAEGCDTINLVAVCYPNFEVIGEKDPAVVTPLLESKIAALNKKLVSYKRIHSVEVRSSEFEKTTTRKIRRNLVK